MLIEFQNVFFVTRDNIIYKGKITITYLGILSTELANGIKIEYKHRTI